jgi:transforming growth factor-beta-induced protein
MSETQGLIETIEKVDMFSVFARLMRTSGANHLISGEGAFTVFAPTNDAFNKIPDRVMNGWLSETSQERLKSVLSYHIVPTKIMAASLGTTRTADSVSGEPMKFTDLSGLRVNRSGIQARNMMATNGVVHALDTVMTPPTAEEAVQIQGQSRAGIEASINVESHLS